MSSRYVRQLCTVKTLELDLWVVYGEAENDQKQRGYCQNAALFLLKVGVEMVEQAALQWQSALSTLL